MVAPLMAGQMPVAVVPGGKRQVDSHNPRPQPVVEATLCPPAADSSTSFSEPSSSLPSPRGTPGHSALLCRSHPDPSLPLHQLLGPARGVSSVFVSGDAYANPAAVMFLSLKIVVLPVADGRRPGRRSASFKPG